MPLSLTIYLFSPILHCLQFSDIGTNLQKGLAHHGSHRRPHRGHLGNGHAHDDEFHAEGAAVSGTVESRRLLFHRGVGRQQVRRGGEEDAHGRQRDSGRQGSAAACGIWLLGQVLTGAGVKQRRRDDKSTGTTTGGVRGHLHRNLLLVLLV